MGGGRGYSLHGVREGVDACAEVNGNIPEPCKLADTSVLQFRFNKVISWEVVRDTKGIESVGSNISIKVRGIGKEWNGLGLFGSEACGTTACLSSKLMVRFLYNSMEEAAQNLELSYHWRQGQMQRQSQQGQRERQASWWTGLECGWGGA
jgi:hypothetical protein